MPLSLLGVRHDARHVPCSTSHKLHDRSALLATACTSSDSIASPVTAPPCCFMCDAMTRDRRSHSRTSPPAPPVSSSGDRAATASAVTPVALGCTCAPGMTHAGATGPPSTCARTTPSSQPLSISPPCAGASATHSGAPASLRSARHTCVGAYGGSAPAAAAAPGNAHTTTVPSSLHVAAVPPAVSTPRTQP
eukprot:365224-Chlamydomonas_euryale.AAC.23